MATTSRYKYQVSLNFVKGSSSTTIPVECIQAVIIDHDYEKSNMPKIIISANIDSKVYNIIYASIDSATFSLRISRCDLNSTVPIYKDYIYSSFVYFLPKGPNFEDVFNPKNISDNIDTTQTTGNISYKSISIGLMDISIINKNKIIHPDIYKNVNMSSLIHLLTKHLKVIFEPLEYNHVFDSIILPPLRTVSKEIAFLNNLSYFYEEDHVFFIDIDKTYLLSKNGKSVSLNNGEYDDVLIDIVSSISAQAQYVGIVIDDINKLYHLYTDALETDIVTDTATNRSYNKTIGVTTEGAIVEDSIGLKDRDEGVEKYFFQRLPNENINAFDDIEENKVTISVSKSDLDGSIFTPNKKYSVNIFEGQEICNGDYTLSDKKEILLQKDGEFISALKLTLNKVM